MAVQYVDPAIAGVQRGLENAEAGILVEEVSQAWNDPMDQLRNHFNETLGFAHNYDRNVTLAVSGETLDVATPTGLLAATFGAAVTIGNFIDNLFGIDLSGTGETGEIFMQDATITANRDAFRNFSANYIAWPNVTVA